MKKLSKILEILKLKWLRETTLTIVLIAIIVAIFIGVNIAVDKLDPQDIDLTTEKLYTLSEESKKQISKIPEEDKIKIYMFDVEENTSSVDLARQYSRIHKNIEVEVVKTSNRLDLVSKYNVEENMGSILIIVGDKHKLLTYNDLYTIDYNTGTTIDITEQRITNSIVGISSIGKATPIYILKGHGEYPISSALTQMNMYLEIENYIVKEVDLLVNDNIPEDCSALIIATPTKDFAEVEVQKITDYINKGGNILWMNDPFSTLEALPNVQKVLDLYGVTVEKDGIIVEQDISKMLMQTPDLIIPDIESSTLAGDLATEGMVVLLDSGRLKFVENEKLTELKVTKTDLLKTTDKAFFRKDVSIANLAPIEGEEVRRTNCWSSLNKNNRGR